MTLDQLYVLAIFASTIGALVFTQQRPSRIFGIVVLLLLAGQQLTLQQVTLNLINPGLITLVLLLMVSQAVDKTSFIKALGRRLVSASYTRSFFKLFSLTFLSSALLNNTAIVASLIGPVKQNQYHPASKLLIPLSYSAILGGTVTLIGTSTNLIVDSFLRQEGHAGFDFFDFTIIGLGAGIGTGLILFLLKGLLPSISNQDKLSQQYFIEAEVDMDSPLIGKTIEQNHLRNLPELFLAEVVRNGKLISPVNPELMIQACDKLIFSGNVQKVDALNHIPGLSLFAESNGLLRENLLEVIVSNRAQIIGKTLKQLGFRALFDAAVVAVRRDGETLSGKLGEIKLQAGDFLLLATGPDFEKRHNLSRNFFVVSERNFSLKLPAWREWTVLGGFLGSISLAAGGLVSLPLALVFFLAILVVIGVTDSSEARRNLPVNLITVIVGALSLANALQQSGTIALLTDSLGPVLSGYSPFIALCGVYLVTLLLTEMVTNNAAAALMFPFAWGVSQSVGVDILPFALAVAFAASASFMSPHGYQTNLLVFSATRYQFKDFLRYGTPVSLVYSCLVLTLLKWQFSL